MSPAKTASTISSSVLSNSIIRQHSWQVSCQLAVCNSLYRCTSGIIVYHESLLVVASSEYIQSKANSLNSVHRKKEETSMTEQIEESKEIGSKNPNGYQLDRAYDTCKTVYSTAMQFIIITATAEAASLTIGFELKSELALFLGGVVLIGFFTEFRTAGRSFTASVVSALAIEKKLGYVGRYSPMSAFFGSAFGVEKLEKLRTLADTYGNGKQDAWITSVKDHAIFQRGWSIWATLTMGIVQIIAALVFAMTGWLGFGG